jgi:hypothetical protein
MDLGFGGLLVSAPDSRGLFKLKYAYKDMPHKAIKAPQRLTGPGSELNKIYPPSMITLVLNWPSTTWEVAEVALKF